MSFSQKRAVTHFSPDSKRVWSLSRRPCPFVLYELIKGMGGSRGNAESG